LYVGLNIQNKIKFNEKKNSFHMIFDRANDTLEEFGEVYREL